MARKIPGPDQTHSWVIAIASCVINTMLSGITRGTGILYLEMIKIFDVSRMEANVPFALRFVCRSVVGPIVGILGQKYGVQIVTIVGAVLSSVGVILCSFATSITWISVYYGVLHGLGVAFANTLFQATVNQYFFKYKATASGLALSGACLGSFIFPSLLDMFIDNYGLFGAFLLTGGIVMHVLPASIILKEPPWLKLNSQRTRTVHKRSLRKLQTVLEVCADSDQDMTNGKVDAKSERKISEKRKNELKENEKRHASESKEDLYSSDSEQTIEIPFYGRSTRAVSVSQSSLARSASSNKPPDSILKSLWKVYSNPMFHVISLSLTAFAMLFDPLMTIIVDYINDKGLDENVAKYLISILALGDLAGRLCFGWVTDRNFMTMPRFMLVNQSLQGVCFLLFPLFSTFTPLTGLVIVYGLTAGSAIVMFPVLVGKYLPEEQALSIGCMAFSNGLTALAVPPLIGHFRDGAHSYDGMFYINGSISVLVALIWLLEPLLIKTSGAICNSKGHRNTSSIKY